jgi:hemoglobin
MKVRPMLEAKITRDNIETLVIRFYSLVLNDELVGPYFLEELGDDMDNKYWKPHLTRLVDFWASIVMGENTYKRDSFKPHMMMDELDRETFTQWLILFFSTLDEIYEPQIANIFKEKSTNIAEKFMRNLGV